MLSLALQGLVQSFEVLLRLFSSPFCAAVYYSERGRRNAFNKLSFNSSVAKVSHVFFITFKYIYCVQYLLVYDKVSLTISVTSSVFHSFLGYSLG